MSPKAEPSLPPNLLPAGGHIKRSATFASVRGWSGVLVAVVLLAGACGDSSVVDASGGESGVEAETATSTTTPSRPGTTVHLQPSLTTTILDETEVSDSCPPGLVCVLPDGSVYDDRWFATVTLDCGPTRDERRIAGFVAETAGYGAAQLSAWRANPDGSAVNIGELTVGSVVDVNGLLLNWRIGPVLLGPWPPDEVVDACDDPDATPITESANRAPTDGPVLTEPVEVSEAPREPYQPNSNACSDDPFAAAQFAFDGVVIEASQVLYESEVFAAHEAGENVEDTSLWVWPWITFEVSAWYVQDWGAQFSVWMPELAPEIGERWLVGGDARHVAVLDFAGQSGLADPCLSVFADAASTTTWADVFGDPRLTSP